MPIIEKIEKSKHKQERVLVFLEGGDLLRITESELLRFGLSKGIDIPTELSEELAAAGKRSELKAAAARIASGKMLSRRELTQRLIRKGARPEMAAETADWLEELGAVDDESYAGVIVRHYGAMGYGPARVRQELQRRGVPKAFWDSAMEQLPPAEEVITQYLCGKLRGKNCDKDSTRKLGAALQRRGFHWNDIRPVLRRFSEWEDDDFGNA